MYVGDDGKPQIQARLQDENMWLTQVQLAQVFQTTRQNIGQHIKNIYEEKELDPSATIKKFFIVQTDIATNFRIWTPVQKMVEGKR